MMSTQGERVSSPGALLILGDTAFHRDKSNKGSCANARTFIFGELHAQSVGAMNMLMSEQAEFARRYIRRGWG